MFVTKIRADGSDDRSVFGDFWFEPITVRGAAGVRVSPESALRLTAVYACVRILAETMGCLPFCLYTPRADGGRDVVKDHWLTKLMRKPNRWQDGFQWREMVQGHVALRGVAYNEIVPDGRGGIAELFPKHPDRMSVELLDSRNFRYCYIQQDGSKKYYAPSQIFRVMGLSSNGLTALNPIELARESIGEGLAQQDYGARFMANDARPMGGWIEMQGKFPTKPDRDNFRESWQQAQTSVNRGKTAILEGGMKYHELGLKNVDAQFIEGRKLKVSDIARIFRVPPHMIADLERSTNNNIEWQSMEFVKFTMLPWSLRWEAAVKDQLLGYDDDLEVAIDFWSLERGDMKSRSDYYHAGIVDGWLERNDARVKEGMNPDDSIKGFLQPLNMVPAGTKPPATPPAADKADAGDAGDAGDVGDAGDANEDQARARVLELAIAGRIVRKEIVAIGRAHERHRLNAEIWRKWLADFYSEHVAYVADSLLCSTETAAAWCDRQLDELFEATDQEIASGGKEPKIEPLLEAWETTAAAELAARVQTSGQRKEKA